MFKNHPKGLLLAALSNMGERFGYYIMNAVLVLFLCSKFGLSDETSGLIAAIFLAAIYVLSLAGGAIADRTQNYKATISWGLVIMALGYAMLSVPILSTPDNISWLLPLTVFALAMIACGNGLFKGNLQAIVGQMYDDFEAEAAKQGPDRLKWAQGQRDAGFQIFYVFINVGALVAPFIAPLLRSWWLSQHGLVYNADLPKLCHAPHRTGGQSRRQHSRPVGFLLAVPRRLQHRNTLFFHCFGGDDACFAGYLRMLQKAVPNSGKEGNRCF